MTTGRRERLGWCSREVVSSLCYCRECVHGRGPRWLYFRLSVQVWPIGKRNMLLEVIMQRVHNRDVAPDGRKKEKTLIEREKDAEWTQG